MGFLAAVKTCLVKLLTVEGRASRSEFWWFQLFYMLATFGLLVATAVILPEASEATLIRAPSVMAVVLFVPVCAAGVRRFQISTDPAGICSGA